MKNQWIVFLVSMALTSLASARGAVSYSCSGYEPNTSGHGSLSKQSVIFTLISAQDETTVTITNKSNENVDPKNSELIVEKGDCEFEMIPDNEYPAYRIHISGTCGTSIKQTIKGICFFD